MLIYAWNEHDEGGWCCPTLTVDETGNTVTDEYGNNVMDRSHLDAIKKAQNEKYDVILIDTAGRLQNKFNLMEELSKIKNVINKNAQNELRESILVLDANTGQNGLQQAKVFKECVDLTSVALTKLDGSAKGAIVLAIAKELKLPVKLVGVGEQMDDLKDFDSKEFIQALFK